MSDNTDAEFVAEIEAMKLGEMGTFGGVPVVFTGGTNELLREAVERLKRATEYSEDLHERVRDLTAIVENYQRGWTAKAEKHAKQIAELKELLRWCRDEIAADFGADKAAEWTDSPWVRIEELLKEKP